MHIGISSLMIQNGKTGVGQYLFALLRALQSQNQGPRHRFTVFALEGDVALFRFADGMAVVSVSEQYRSPVKNILWHQARLPGLAQRHGLDLLHIPSYRRLLWRRPCALVATIHDLAPFRVPKKYDWKRMFYGRVIVRWLAHQQDRILAVSRNTAGDIIKFFRVPESRVSVVHNGVEHARFFPGSVPQARAWMARRFGLSGPFFLYVARLEHPGKNHLRLIDAFNRFKATTDSRWQLVFGGSDWHGSQAIHAAINASPYRAEIRALGFVPDSDLPEMYRAAEAMVYPSLYEGFGMPTIEAMACGCPVMASTRGSLAEVVGDAALITDPENVRDMAEQLTRMATDESKRVQLRAAGLARARLFDWSRTAATTLEVYESALRHGDAVAQSRFGPQRPAAQMNK
jgi:glycosyltransferase involved in cell wall biosynthesis